MKGDTLFPVTFDPNLTLMLVDDLLANGQSEPRSFVCIGTSLTVQLNKFIEKFADIVRRNTRSIVDDTHLNFLSQTMILTLMFHLVTDSDKCKTS